MEVDLDPSQDGIDGQGHRSRSNIKIEFFSLLSEKKVRCQGHQGQRSSLKVIGQGDQDHCRYQEQGQRKRSIRSGSKVKFEGQGHSEQGQSC